MPSLLVTLSALLFLLSLIVTLLAMSEAKMLHAQGERSMWKCFAIDAVSAGVASALVSPIVAAIDICVVTRAATGASLATCFRSWLARPKASLLANISMPFLVYLGTYTTANTFDTAHALAANLDPATPSATTSKFLATTIISTGLTIAKDAYFARRFGAAAGSARVPAGAYGLFLVRDAVTIFACFNGPALVAPALASSSSVAGFTDSPEASLRTAQMLMPAAVQFVSTPIHLLGLDLHNRQTRVGVASRAREVGRGMPVATPLRMCRIIPAFGFGGAVNTSVRRSLLARGDRGEL